MNFLIKPWLIIPVIALFAGCDDGAYSTLSPPENAHWVTVEFTSPAGTTLSPAYLFYHSDICKAKQSNSSGGMDEIDGVYGVDQPYARKGETNIWQARVAIEGGGPCQWKLNSLKISFKIAEANNLTRGKDNIETSYIFDFGEFTLSNGYGVGKARKIEGNLKINTDFFPLITHHSDETTSFKLFGGDTSNDKWTRRFRLSQTQLIQISPLIHLNKIVIIRPPNTNNSATRELISTYPNGSTENIPYIYPNYEKLLSMK